MSRILFNLYIDDVLLHGIRGIDTYTVYTIHIIKHEFFVTLLLPDGQIIVSGNGAFKKPHMNYSN